jgi:hypothetical protein
MVKNIRIRIRDEHPGSYFRELRNHLLGLKYLNSLMRIQDPGWKKYGSGMEKNSDPGSGRSETLVFQSVETDPYSAFLCQKQSIIPTFV